MATPPRRTTLGLLGCALLLAAYAAVAWAAAGRESPTFDEPYHAVSAWVQLRHDDFRVDNEDPPLWQYWASLPNGRRAIRADFAGPRWRGLTARVAGQWRWVIDTLYHTPGNDAAAFIRRCRAMMLIVAVGLGVAIAAWAWRLGGATAAVVATAAFALDPNFLAHGPLMKNDVAASLAWLAVAWALWAVGRRATWASIATLAVLAAVPATVKFSGLLVGGLVPVSLGVRAMLPEAWPVLGRSLTTRWGRATAAAVIVFVAAVVAYGGVWAAYGFQFRPGGTTLEIQPLAEHADGTAALARGTRTASPLAVRAAVFADAHRLLPQPFVAGFLFTYGESLIRPAYLLGELSLTGWWYYFPFAMAVKTPVATLAAAGLLVAAARRAGDRWAAISLAVPVALYLASALTTNLNIGLRHVLPVYPPVFVGLGWTASAALRRRPRPARVVVGLLAAGLAVETAVAFPWFVSFFNAPAAVLGHGGYDLLGDSNLDWGQGLIALRQWQDKHPAEPMYLSYFGLADPAAYGLRYTTLPGGYLYDGPPRQFQSDRPCWVAISESMLQLAAEQPGPLRAYYQRLAARPPTAVVGGSIYLYHYDPLEPDR